jgi:RNA polymerase sigma-70 factor, ECF subfamily
MAPAKNQAKINGLVKKMQAGDTEAFGEIYDIFLSDIYRFIYYKVTHKELAEDLTEDTFFKAWQKIDKYKKTKHPFSAWLYRIAHNTVIDYLRKEKISIDEIVEEIKDERMNSQQSTELYFNQQFLQRALVKLPESQREAIILKYVNDLSNKEIAITLDKSETAVRILLSRGLASVKEKVRELEEEK